MRCGLSWWLAGALLLLAPVGLWAQSLEGSGSVAEDFALAVATAHARTSLFGADTRPFSIHATVTSRLALHGVGQGTYENEWVDAQHWRRVIDFPDFQQTEMRNDGGHSWTNQPGDVMPLRIAELLRVVVIHVPSSTAASRVSVTETAATGPHGEAEACFASTVPPSAEGSSRSARWCFEKSTGLLVSQDMPLNTHIVYSGYIAFQGKREFTHVRVTAGSLPVLEIAIQYASLDPHALDGSVPDETMHRSASAGTAPNPEEFGKGTVEYSFNPPLPAGASAADAKRPVQVQFHVSADNAVVDACVEDAATEQMAEAALQGARRFTFTPQTIDGKPAGSRFYQSIWFKDAKTTSGAGALSEGADADGVTVGPGQRSGGSYVSKDPSFVFRYPADFEPLPRGELEERLQSTSGTHAYGLEPGAQCNTLLFRAQRLRPGERSPEVVSMYELSSLCVSAAVDAAVLENVAGNAARSIVAQWADGRMSKPKPYTVNGRTFAVVSASGSSRAGVPEQTQALVLITQVHGEVVGWTVVSNGTADQLAETLGECTLQVGDGQPSPLPTP